VWELWGMALATLAAAGSSTVTQTRQYASSWPPTGRD
jgi:hypothetical protein